MNSPTTIPILEDNEQKLVTMRGALEQIFLNLNQAHDIAIVCGRASEAVNSDTDDEVSNVLRQFCSNEIYRQLRRLTRIIEQLGGQTEFSGYDDAEDVEVE